MSALVNPTIDPKAAFAWDLQKIGTYLDDVKKNPTKYCSNPAYNKPVSDGKETRIHVEAAADFIKTCAFAKEPHTFNANLPGIGVEFEGCALPDNTVFDVLGWLLSVCSDPPVNATDRTYYLPLISLFGRWCRLLGREVNTPPMVHIAWFKGKSGKMLVLLGSTIGSIDNPLRQSAVERERQSELIALHFEPKEADGQLVKSDKIICRKGEIVNQLFKLAPNENEAEWVKSGKGFGICAETFFYIVARHLGKSIINEKTVKGLALRPRLLGKEISDFQKLTNYDEVAAAKVLADPCTNSCQFLVPQLGTLDKDPPWNWENIFAVKALQEAIAPGTYKPAKGSTGGSSSAANKAPAPAAGATPPAKAGGANGAAKPTFKGAMGGVIVSAIKSAS